MQTANVKRSNEDTKVFCNPEEIIGYLVALEKISKEDASRVESLVTATRSTWGSVLDRLGILTQKDWIEIVSEVLSLQLFDLTSFHDKEQISDRISLDFLKSRLILPLALSKDSPVLVTANPWDLASIQAIELAFNCSVEIQLATEREIEAVLSRLEEQFNNHSNAVSDIGNFDDAQNLLEMANEAPTIRAVEDIFDKALQSNATDIHIEPMANTGRVRFRINGVLSEGEQIPQNLYQGVISRIKILSDLDIAERRRPQDGRMGQRYQGRQFDIRVATLPTILGESMALRVLANNQELVSLESLKMPPWVQEIVDLALKQRNGLIVVTGPTGSGKTTTLHSALSSLNDVSKKILTAENPVEIRLAGAIQVEARKEIDLDFANILKSFLRHDPDILMIGEIRDTETAKVAIQAALTGRLVFSTLHTNSASSAISRLVDLGVEPFFISSVLRASLAQRLVRVLCSCAVPYQSIHGSKPAMHMDGATIQDTSRMQVAQGCDACGNSGFSSQRAIFEVIGRDHIESILNNKSVEVQNLLNHGKQLVENGTTTADELARVLDTNM